MYPVTPKNIRLRYLAEKDHAKDSGSKFTYEMMGDIFLVSGQACYMWTVPVGDKAHRSPPNKRMEKVKEWINDGRLDAYIRKSRGPDTQG